MVKRGGEFGPDTKPVSILLIDLRTTNLEFGFIDDGVTNVLGPGKLNVAEASEVAIIADFGKNDLKEGLSD
jgi:hypothetical protein